MMSKEQAKKKAEEILSRCEHEWIPMMDGSLDEICIKCTDKRKRRIRPPERMAAPLMMPLMAPLAAPLAREISAAPDINKQLYDIAAAAPISLDAAASSAHMAAKNGEDPWEELHKKIMAAAGVSIDRRV